MKIQDIVFGFGSIFFMVALIPSLMSKDKPQYWTSVMTGVILFLYSLAYLSLKLPLAFVTSAATAIAWLALAYQKKYHK